MKTSYLKFPHGAIQIDDNYGIDIASLLSSLPIFFTISEEANNAEPIILKILFQDHSHLDEFLANEKMMIHGGAHTEYAYYYTFSNSEIHYAFDDGLYIKWNKERNECYCYLKSKKSTYLRFFIKEYVFEYLFSLGYCTLHAAAFSYHNNSYIIVGNKGAGKTTLLLGLYAIDDNVKIISNDRVLVRKVGHKYSILSADTGIRAMPDTIDLLELHCKFDDRKHFVKKNYSDKMYSSLRDFDRIMSDVITLKAIIVSDPTESNSKRFTSNAPSFTVVQDREEHPRWLNFDETQSIATEEQFLRDEFDCLTYNREENIREKIVYITDFIKGETNNG